LFQAGSSNPGWCSKASDRLLAGVEGNEGAVESECDTLGEDAADDVGEFEGSVRIVHGLSEPTSKPAVLAGMLVGFGFHPPS
jgi:hypothetical protein